MLMENPRGLWYARVTTAVQNTLGGGETGVNYEEARRMIEESSWYKEITGRNFPAGKLINLSRQRFECELQSIIDRHKRQQVHVDEIKRHCHVNA